MDYFRRITHENKITQSIEYILLDLDIKKGKEERHKESQALKDLQNQISGYISNGAAGYGPVCAGDGKG